VIYGCQAVFWIRFIAWTEKWYSKFIKGINNRLDDIHGSMINILERQFDPLDSEAGKLANGFDKLTIKKIKERSSALLKGLGAYFKRLLFP